MKEIREIQDATAKAEQVGTKSLMKLVSMFPYFSTVETPDFIIQRPDKENSDHLDFFLKGMEELFKKCPCYKRTGTDNMRAVFEFQLWILCAEWRARRIKLDPDLKNMTRPAFVFRCLKHVQRIDLTEVRDEILKTMLEDYQKMSLNPM